MFFLSASLNSRKLREMKNNLIWQKKKKKVNFVAYGYLKFAVRANYKRALTFKSRTKFILDLYREVGNTKCIASSNQN